MLSSSRVRVKGYSPGKKNEVKYEKHSYQGLIIHISRYAHGLIREGDNLLSYVIIIFIGILCTNFLLFWPIVGNLFEPEYPQNYIKGQVCMMIPLKSGMENQEINLKSKLIVMAIGKISTRCNFNRVKLYDNL